MQEIFDSLKKLSATLYVASAGGGAEAIAGIAAYPGRSSVILGANFINDTNLFNQWVGVNEWKKYSSMESAEKLALKSQEVGKYARTHVGIGIASSLATYNERVGRDNVFNICAIGYNFKIKKSYKFPALEHTSTKDKRKFQEDIINNYLAGIISAIYDLLLIGYTNHEDVYQVECINNLPVITDEVINIYPGSFNPIHDGHKHIASRSEFITGAKTYYELSLLNFEKAAIDFSVFNERVRKIDREVILTYQKTFVEKYKFLKQQYPHLKQINFICGIDTFNRIYFEDLDWLLKQGDVKFLVWARDGKWIFEQEQSIYKSMLYNNLELRTYDNPVSSSKIRNGTVS